MVAKVLGGADDGAAWVLATNKSVRFAVFDGPVGLPVDFVSSLQDLLKKVPEASDWPDLAMLRLRERLGAPDGPLPDSTAVSCALGMVASGQLTIVWAGDVRTHCKVGDGEWWTTVDHTVAAQAAASGRVLTGPSYIYEAALTRTVGRLPSADPERNALVLSSSAHVFVCTRACHQHRSPETYVSASFNDTLQHGSSVMPDRELVLPIGSQVAICID